MTTITVRNAYSIAVFRNPANEVEGRLYAGDLFTGVCSVEIIGEESL